MTALTIAGLAVALVVAVGACLRLLVSLAVTRGAGRDLVAQLAEATAEYERLAERNRQLGDDLSAARLDADMLRAGAIPDAATPELMARIDDLPHRRRSVEREIERWADLVRRTTPADIAGPYLPTPAEDAAWRDLAARLESR